MDLSFPFNLSHLVSLLFVLGIFSSFSQADVPPSKTFTYVNSGEFGDFVVEYGGNYRTTPLFTSPFQLCFYNTTPNAYTLALRIGTTRSESLMRWVWDANRGNPVGEDATLTFGPDGNLVLAEADGLVVWKTDTANKGVTGLNLLPNGNIVLHDAAGHFIWQSFDYPTDTLLMGQSIRVGSVTKLISRVSAEQNVDGPYSLELERKTVNMYYKSPFSSKTMLYYTFLQFIDADNGVLDSFKFVGRPETEEAFAYDLLLEAQIANTLEIIGPGIRKPKYNITLSYMRLTIDGNLKWYSFYPKMESIGGWDDLYTWFGRESDPYAQISECQLPERCGKFGLCEESQCVACPRPEGLLGWSSGCEPPKLPPCGSKDFYYYRLEGVDHFISGYTRGDGPKDPGECEKKCSKDCKCVGYFYHEDTSRCWIVYDLKSLTRVSNPAHVGFIKASDGRPKSQTTGFLMDMLL